MRLGVHLPVAGKGASPSTSLQVAEEAERSGLDSVWSWERLMRPTVPIALGGAGGPVMDAPEEFGMVYDPIETLAYVAARTSRITLGTSVIDALFHSPVILARRLATLDRLSDGRLIAGIGQGWMEQEFQAAGVSTRRQFTPGQTLPCERYPAQCRHRREGRHIAHRSLRSLRRWQRGARTAPDVPDCPPHRVLQPETRQPLGRLGQEARNQSLQ